MKRVRIIFEIETELPDDVNLEKEEVIINCFKTPNFSDGELRVRSCGWRKNKIFGIQMRT